jgi:hypothetical protein
MKKITSTKAQLDMMSVYYRIKYENEDFREFRNVDCCDWKEIEEIFGLDENSLRYKKKRNIYFFTSQILLGRQARYEH